EKLIYKEEVYAIKKKTELCYIIPYCEILKKYQYNVSEQYLFGIGEGIGFQYNYIHNNVEVMEYISKYDWISIQGSNDITKSIEKNFGILFYKYFNKNNNETLEFCKSELKAGRVIILFLDVYYLKYHPQYKRLHGQTNVLLLNIDSQKEKMKIYDGHVNTIPVSSYQGDISYNEFLKAIIQNKNEFTSEKSGIVAYKKIFPKHRINIWDSIEKNAKLMLYSQIDNLGLNGIKSLADEVLKWNIYWEEKDLKEVFRRAYLHITGRGGPAISRKVYGEFLKEYCKDENVDINSISKIFLELSKKWNSIAIQFFRGSLDREKCNLKKISNELKDIELIERQVFLKLECIGRENGEKDYEIKG
ncbi:MAG: DUF4872 domain-containing protein, partial [Sarcina sp.]